MTGAGLARRRPRRAGSSRAGASGIGATCRLYKQLSADQAGMGDPDDGCLRVGQPRHVIGRLCLVVLAGDDVSRCPLEVAPPGPNWLRPAGSLRRGI
jgi:hypothetical protein